MSPLLAFICRCCIYGLCLLLSFYGMSSLDFEKLLKKNHVPQAQILYALLVMSLAYLSAQFIISFMYFL